MSLYTNLEWGRFDAAREILDNYLTDFTDAKGMINMRGPETAQFGMTLSLLARYFNYTQDAALLVKHREKIIATAAILIELHDESLKLPKDDVGYGIIHGWSESDSCLHPKPMVWWLPYFANNAFAARGLKDIGRVWPAMKPGSGAEATAGEWLKRSKILQDARDREHAEECANGCEAAVYWAVAGNDADVSRIAGKRTSQSAAMGASRLCGTVAAGRAACEPWRTR